jgi:hypothetical protein
MAKTDIEAALALLDRQVARIVQCQGREYGVWIPIASHGQRHFWEFIRNKATEKAYRILGRFKSPGVWRGFYKQLESPVIDLGNHRQLLLTIAREDQTSALVFATVVCVSQPGFFEFAYGLLDFYPKDNQIKNALSDAVDERPGFGNYREHGTKAVNRIEEQLRRVDLSTTARDWLNSLKKLLKSRMDEERRYFQDDNYVSWD